MLWVGSPNSQRKQMATWKSHSKGSQRRHACSQTPSAAGVGGGGPRWSLSLPGLRINCAVFTCFLFKCSVLESGQNLQEQIPEFCIFKALERAWCGRAPSQDWPSSHSHWASLADVGCSELQPRGAGGEGWALGEACWTCPHAVYIFYLFYSESHGSVFITVRSPIEPSNGTRVIALVIIKQHYCKRWVARVQILTR